MKVKLQPNTFRLKLHHVRTGDDKCYKVQGSRAYIPEVYNSRYACESRGLHLAGLRLGCRTPKP